MAANTSDSAAGFKTPVFNASPPCERKLCHRSAESRSRPGAHRRGSASALPGRSQPQPQVLEQVEEQIEASTMAIGLADLALPAEVLQAVAHGHDSEQGHDKVKDAPQTAEKCPYTKHSQRQEGLADHQYADADFQGFLPTVVLPLGQVPIVLHTLYQVPAKQEGRDDEAR
eukprot:CAMPEP_0204526992 /NCGR_PEP_ID=MMETSP0661-20131031/8732_1 /ASSEMBLY_ACC=CAM_ASM_000606 /TAXON_ID=109239 /ORGANISM="Alexandrium margalefi, Strain AMGDE01CS-322" /LENGTH=170 /DNA_ID=CAMNT_0051532859 /DNA_START=24 /DNA_END=537 /DNA_ORIENTATION=-